MQRTVLADCIRSSWKHQPALPYSSWKPGIVDTNGLHSDPDLELWPNLDPDPRVIMLYTYEYVINLEKMGDNL